eukprot:EG_transcript_6055
MAAQCGDDASTTLAVVNPEKCQPRRCRQECVRCCPVVRHGPHCVDITFGGQPAAIAEELCIGCGACSKQCPFGAIKVVRLPRNLERLLTHRFGLNGFKLHGLPLPRPGHLLGLLGANGTGKSTAFKILAGQLRPNLGHHTSPPDWPEVIKAFKGSELQRHLTRVRDHACRAVVKPQHVEQLAARWQGTVGDVWATQATGRDTAWLRQFGLEGLADRPVARLSGGELQRLALAVTCGQAADVYLFDEPSSYLDVKQRLVMVRNVRDLLDADDTRALVAVEHDLCTLDYLSDTVAFFCGEAGAYGLVTSPYGVAPGIHLFLNGFLPSENFRFRPEPLDFELGRRGAAATAGAAAAEAPASLQYPAATVSFGAAFSLSIEAGAVAPSQVVVMLGENGIGKTTFIKALTGQLSATGSISMPAFKASVKPQHVALKAGSAVAAMTVKAVLDQKVHPDLQRQEAWRLEVLGPLGLEELYPRQMGHLSGGELQRVSLALALGKGTANLYLIDEPSAYLDCEQRLAVGQVIRSFVRRHKTTAFVIEHDVMMAAYLADAVIVFDGVPSAAGHAAAPQPFLAGMNAFLHSIGVTFRCDGDVQPRRPRINKLGSVKDREQKTAGQYFFMQ